MAVLWAMRNSQLESRRVVSNPARLRNALTNVSCARSSASARSAVMRAIRLMTGRSYRRTICSKADWEPARACATIRASPTVSRSIGMVGPSFQAYGQMAGDVAAEE